MAAEARYQGVPIGPIGLTPVLQTRAAAQIEKDRLVRAGYHAKVIRA